MATATKEEKKAKKRDRRPLKCDPTKAKFCRGLIDHYEVDQYKAGVQQFITFNLDDNKNRCRGLRYKKTNRTDEGGMMLNFCPHCGTDLRLLHDNPVVVR